MKKTFLFFVFCCNVFTYHQSCAQSWINVGSADFSGGEAGYPAIAIDTGGTPYVVYEDFSHAGNATVMRYVDTGWVPVGGVGFSTGRVEYTSIVIDKNGTLYVAYEDGYNSGPATVMKYNGSSWAPLGSPGFSAGGAYYVSMALDGSGTPFVVYEDSVNNNKATVMKFNGSSWVTVGSPGFSAGAVKYTSIAIDSSGTPYVVYEDIANGTKATVMKYNGSAWVNVGSAGFSGANVWGNKWITIDGGGTPYVAYPDWNDSQKVTVMKYNGSSWVDVGAPGFSDSIVEFTSIVFDASGTPYVVYTDYSTTTNFNATVMKYNGSNWIPVGSPGFSGSGGSLNISIALNSSGTPYVVYQDLASINRATVMRYGFPTEIEPIVITKNLSIFPNPTSNSVTISALDNITTISITNLIGQTIYTNQYNATQIQVDVSPLPAGVYFVKINGIEVRKFVRQ